MFFDLKLKRSLPIALLLLLPGAHSLPQPVVNVAAVPLRILPLGDSITYGYYNGHPEGSNGYREELRNRLIKANNSVDFVGTLKSGTMQDNENEGHSGWTINQVRNVLGPALKFKPNVVLVHLATNDLNGAQTSTEPWSAAPQRLGNVIDDILAKLPNAAIFVAKIVQTTNAASEARFKTYNNAIPDVVKQRTAKGSKVFLVDQSVIGGSELGDYLHPSPAGYKHMGDIWADAVLANLGAVSAPPA